MSVNQRTLNDVVLAYIESWSTPDEVVRRELGGRCLVYRSCV
jgi:hypothetical protein